MKQHLYQSIADRFEAHIATDPTVPIPSLPQLARQWSVALPTMWRAVHVLVDRNVLACSPGKRITVAPIFLQAHGHTVAPCVTSALRLSELIRSRILDGTYATGNALPKQEVFVRSEHVSYNDVIAAVKILAGEQLVHKLGKRWIVGPAGMPLERSHADGPVVLLIAPFPTWVHNFFSAAHTLPFGLAFRDELQKYGIRLIVGSQNHVDIESSAMLSGIDQVRSVIRGLGPRYCGALVHSGEYFDGLEAWLRELHALGKPLVYFDTTGQGTSYTRTRLGLSSRYVRCFFDERSAVNTVIATLARHGHRRVGLPLCTGAGSEQWMSRRILLVNDAVSTLDCGLQIFSTEQRESFWEFSHKGWTGFHDRISRCLTASAAAASEPRGLRQALLECTPSLATLLDQGITALIGPNDYVAYEYYQWLRSAAIEVPRHVSVVGFDNVPESVTFPVSTIDFGFGRLGYMAAHLFVGDLPIRGDATGNIPGLCTYVDRGSVAAPSTVAL